jgi:hypothetical protein
MNAKTIFVSDVKALKTEFIFTRTFMIVESLTSCDTSTTIQFNFKPVFLIHFIWAFTSKQ